MVASGNGNGSPGSTTRAPVSNTRFSDVVEIPAPGEYAFVPDTSTLAGAGRSANSAVAETPMVVTQAVVRTTRSRRHGRKAAAADGDSRPKCGVRSVTTWWEARSTAFGKPAGIRGSAQPSNAPTSPRTTGISAASERTAPHFHEVPRPHIVHIRVGDGLGTDLTDGHAGHGPGLDVIGHRFAVGHGRLRTALRLGARTSHDHYGKGPHVSGRSDLPPTCRGAWRCTCARTGRGDEHIA